MVWVGGGGCEVCVAGVGEKYGCEVCVLGVRRNVGVRVVEVHVRCVTRCSWSEV